MNVLVNNSMNMINFDDRLRLKSLINISVLLSTSFVIIVSLIIIVYLIVINDSKKSFNVSLLLTCSTCLTVIYSNIILILIQLSSISGDRNIIAIKRIIFWACYTRSYLLFVFVNLIYLSYVLQVNEYVLS
jgi:hypothetical protein